MKGQTIVGVIAGSEVQANGLPFVGCLEALASWEATQCVHFLNKSVQWCVMDVNDVLWVPMSSFVFYMTMGSKFNALVKIPVFSSKSVQEVWQERAGNMPQGVDAVCRHLRRPVF
jgi:hypothetical protein